MNHKYKVKIIINKINDIEFTTDTYQTMKRWLKTMIKGIEYKQIRITNRRTKKTRIIQGNITE